MNRLEIANNITMNQFSCLLVLPPNLFQSQMCMNLYMCRAQSLYWSYAESIRPGCGSTTIFIYLRSWAKSRTHSYAPTRSRQMIINVEVMVGKYRRSARRKVKELMVVAKSENEPPRSNFRGRYDKAYPDMMKNTQTAGGPWYQSLRRGSFNM